jgi:hypothetical protein
MRLFMVRRGPTENALTLCSFGLKHASLTWEAMAEEVEENGVYRFYHGSFKVFNMQGPIKEAFKLIDEIGGEDDPPHFDYALLVKAGTENDFAGDRTNANWDAETKPILEAFWHTKYFINMMVKYGKSWRKLSRRSITAWRRCSTFSNCDERH